LLEGVEVVDDEGEGKVRRGKERSYIAEIWWRDNDSLPSRLFIVLVEEQFTYCKSS
jgi:predicted mannosyl-3-phosphoglycerate phosphatase (HAD superfamily)